MIPIIIIIILIMSLTVIVIIILVMSPTETICGQGYRGESGSGQITPILATPVVPPDDEQVGAQAVPDGTRPFLGDEEATIELDGVPAGEQLRQSGPLRPQNNLNMAGKW